MSDPSQQSRFKPQNTTTQSRLSTNTVGLVALSDFRKRRAEVLEQQEREARDAALSSSNTNTNTNTRANNSAAGTPDRSLTGTPVPPTTGNNASAENSEVEVGEREAKKVKRDGAGASASAGGGKKVVKKKKALVSFGDEEEEEEGGAVFKVGGGKKGKRDTTSKEGDDNKIEGTEDGSSGEKEKGPSKITANTSVGVVPRALTKAALRREAAEREALRKEFLLLQAAVKATEIAIPFVFYDGTNIPGGVVRVKKGDFIWLFLDRSRKVGAQLEVGADKSSNARRDWARVNVDDLMLVRGTMIIPHHYEFYFFIINQTLGPGNKLLFDYSAEAPPSKDAGAAGLSRAASISELEGASDDPTITKVVDRRWYQRNKHIYPANVWQEFEPDKDYSKEIRRDPGGNAFFFSK